MDQDLEHPSWLNESFLSSVLQEGRTDSKVSVLEFVVSRAVSAADNNSSCPYRVKVTFVTSESTATKTEYLFIKVPLSKGVAAEMSKVIDFSSTEPKFYSEILPELESKLRYQFAPKAYYCPLKNGLILKDMKNDGFTMSDRIKQLDYPHCELAIKTLAKYHAASVALHKDNPDLVEGIGKELLFVTDGPFLNDMKIWIESSVSNVGGIVLKMEGYEDIARYITNRAQYVADSMINLFSPKMRGLNVLNHGDLCVNNMLFKHNNKGEVQDILLIDFQMPRFSSPVVDLVYFIWSSADEKVRQAKQQDLYDIYLDILNTTLEELGCEERLSWDELKKDLSSASDWAVAVVCHVLPFILCDDDNAIDMEEVDTLADIKSDMRFNSLRNTKHYRAVLPKIVKQLHSWIKCL